MTKLPRMLLSFSEVIVGTALTAAAFGMIILPRGFAAAGVTGFSKIIALYLPVPLSLIVLVINMALLLLGLLCVGKAFVVKTIGVSILFPAMLELFSAIPMTGLEKDPMLCAVMAAVLLGTGAGLMLRSGASNGGFDTLAVVVHRKTKLPVALFMNIFDAAVILMQAIRQPIECTAYGIFVVTVSAAIVGRIVTMGKGECQVTIFSEHHDQIREALLMRLDVGMTSLTGETGYCQANMKVIISIIPYQKVPELKRILTEIDPSAFVVIANVRSVLGKGYTLDKHFAPPEKVDQQASA